MSSGSRHGVVIGVAAASVIVNLAILASLGVREGADTQVFRSGASHLLAGEPLQGKEPSYRGYESLLAICRALAVGERGVIAVQFGGAALAAVALFALGRALRGVGAGVVTAVLFIFNIDVARWHIYLVTDSLYMSLVVLSAWSVHHAAGRSWLWRVTAALVVVCGASLRPNGWLLIPIALGYWVVRTSLRPTLKLAAVASVLLGFALTLVFNGVSRGAFQSERPDEALRQGVLIYNYDRWRLPMPVEPALGEPGMGSTLSYLLRHPWSAIRLAAARVVIELAHVRPFYSTAHNASVLLFLAFVYPLAVLGFIRCVREPLAWLLSTIVISDLAIVGATFADWDGRFLLHTFSLIVAFASVGLLSRWSPQPSALSAQRSALPHAGPAAG